MHWGPLEIPVELWGQNWRKFLVLLVDPEAGVLNARTIALGNTSSGPSKRRSRLSQIWVSAVTADGGRKAQVGIKE